MTTTVLVTAPDRLFGVEEVWQPDLASDAMCGRMTVDARHAGPGGATALGGLGVLVDEVLGYSLIASLPPRSWTVSTEIWVDVLAPLPAHGVLSAEASTVQTGSYARGSVRDQDGRLVAECRERGRQIADGPDVDATPGPTPVPPVAGGLSALLGLRREDRERYRLPVGGWLENPRHVLHGGVSLAAAEVVAARHRLDAGCPLTTSSLHIVHTRAAPYDAEVELRARTVHAGRTLWVTDVTGAVEDRVVFSARVSAQ